MRGIKMKTKNVILVSIFSVLLFLLCSCKTELKISVLPSGKIAVEYYAVPGKSFSETILAISGEEVFSDEPIVFNANEIKTSVVQTGLEEIDVSGVKNSTLDIKGIIPSDKSDIFSKSGIIKYGTKANDVEIVISAKTLQKFYEFCPEQFQTYIDLFMSPSFTGEEMTTEEYVDLVASVYGQELADEVLTSKLHITLQKNDSKVVKEISLLDLLNNSTSILIK